MLGEAFEIYSEVLWVQFQKPRQPSEQQKLRHKERMVNGTEWQSECFSVWLMSLLSNAR